MRKRQISTGGMRGSGGGMPDNVWRRGGIGVGEDMVKAMVDGFRLIGRT